MSADTPDSRPLPLRGPLPLLAPPHHIDPGDLEGILGEFEGVLGMILWKAVRAVDLWAQASPTPDAPFTEGIANRWLRELTGIPSPPQSVEAIRSLFRELANAGEADREAVAALCLRISAWAEGSSALATAIAFAEAAALSHNTSPTPCLTAGRLLKRRGAYARAEVWLQRALALAIPAGDRMATAKAWSQLGTVLALRGALRAAQASHLRALRVARRHHLKHYAGVVLHDLFATAVLAEDATRAQRYAQQATRVYYPGHPRLAGFAADVAYFQMMQGEFKGPLRVFLAVLPRMTDPKERLFMAANVIRAAGGAGRRDIFESFWTETLSGLRENKIVAGQAWALLDMARGAASLGEWERADEVIGEAVLYAERNGEYKLHSEAESVREFITRRMLPPCERAPHDSAGQKPRGRTTA